MILANVATLEEIETYYSYLDVVIANEVLDIKEEIEEIQSKEIESQMNK